MLAVLQSSAGEIKLLPDGAAPGAGFGRPMALRDGLLVIGAPTDFGNVSFSGAVYVYAADGRSWRLIPSDGSGAGGFGRAVAVDGNLIVVGAPGGSGRAYVYRFNGANWIEEFRSNGGLAPGVAVAVSGNRFIASVSSKTIDGRLIGSGSAHIFRHDGVNWVREFFDQTSFTSAFNSDGFGTAVALEGNTAVVSGHQKIRIYGHDGVKWTLRQQILNRGGSCLALQGDVLLSGSPGDGQQGNAAGAVFQLFRSASGWGDGVKLLPPGRSTGANFGASVALFGNALVAGAPRYSQGPWEIEFAGAAFLFRWQGTAWGLEAALFASDPLTNPNRDELATGLGSAVALDADAVYAGAPQDDEAGTNVGAVYQFTSPWPIYPTNGNGGSDDDGPPPHAGGPPSGAGGRQ